jgi:hypothetical protein
VRGPRWRASRGRVTLRVWKTRSRNACQSLLLGLAKAAGVEAVMETGEPGTRKRPEDIKVFWLEGSGATVGGTVGEGARVTTDGV